MTNQKEQKDKFGYYAKLEPIVMSKVQYYKDDFLKYDKEIFERNPEYVLMGIRDTGTHTIGLHGDKIGEQEHRMIREYCQIIPNYNQTLIIAHKGEYKIVTPQTFREEGGKIIEEWYDDKVDKTIPYKSIWD